MTLVLTTSVMPRASSSSTPCVCVSARRPADEADRSRKGAPEGLQGTSLRDRDEPHRTRKGVIHRQGMSGMQRVANHREMGVMKTPGATRRVVAMATARLFAFAGWRNRFGIALVQRLLLTAILLGAWQSPVHAQVWASEGRLITIGVLTITSKEEAKARWNPTADYLSDRIEGTRFEIRPLYLQEVARAVRQGELHFVHLQPLQFVQLRADYGLEALATRVVDEAGNPSNRFGSAIVRLAGREEISDLGDL
ncbi:hypothetical protein D5687_07480 [Guyparkeria sp. SCN-R1]|nr:hypothetical protein D5687_07480 [Guyparkeria sp. SCN-R1]